MLIWGRYTTCSRNINKQTKNDKTSWNILIHSSVEWQFKFRLFAQCCITSHCRGLLSSLSSYALIFMFSTLVSCLFPIKLADKGLNHSISLTWKCVRESHFTKYSHIRLQNSDIWIWEVHFKTTVNQYVPEWFPVLEMFTQTL